MSPFMQRWVELTPLPQGRNSLRVTFNSVHTPSAHFDRPNLCGALIDRDYG
jgi:hypothetical protein